MSTSVPSPPAPRDSRAEARSRTPNAFAAGSPLMAFIVGALVSGAAVFFVAGSGSDEPDNSHQPAMLGQAPPPAWYDVEAGCRQVRGLVASYGQGGQSGLGFSEVLWVNNLVDATEVAGANTTQREVPGDVTRGEGAVMYAAEKLRVVAIGGALGHPEFPRLLVELTDTCDRYFP